MWAAPGNPGIAAETLAASGRPVELLGIPATDLLALADAAEELSADLTVVGPDDPLGAGIVDVFAARGLRAWGPGRAAARVESSKAFAQGFMERNGLPVPRARAFVSPDDAYGFVRHLGGRCAVKADGPALGKGVVVCRDERAARDAIDAMLVKRAHGPAGSRVVVQELLEGTEVSVHAICDGTDAVLFPLAQDHKAAMDGDQGPNTGGMGVITPAPYLDAGGTAALDDSIVKAFVAACQAEGLEFRGVFYPGVMLTPDGPRVFEINARFGDPEAQAYLPKLETDLVELIDASLAGTLSGLRVAWNDFHVVCVVLASAGYPSSYETGHEIYGLDEVTGLPRTKVFHAATRTDGATLQTAGGRVLGVTAWDRDLCTARDNAYYAAELVSFANKYKRTDIGAKALL
jgi:phosphoribosylamine---glycine ligase